jgi:hypothetical protein
MKLFNRKQSAPVQADEGPILSLLPRPVGLPLPTDRGGRYLVTGDEYNPKVVHVEFIGVLDTGLR